MMTANFKGAQTRINLLEADLKAFTNENETFKKGMYRKSESDDQLIENLRQENRKLAIELERLKVNQKFKIERIDSSASSGKSASNEVERVV